MTTHVPDADPWQALAKAHGELGRKRTLQLFDEDPRRAQDFSAEAHGLLLDYSKQAIDRGALAALCALADACDLGGQRDAMFRGEAINSTEGRAVLHTALRDPAGEALIVSGEDVRAAVSEELERMCAFAQAVRQGELRTNDGGRFTTIVNIGIGGSDLGPKMVVEALAPYADAGLCFHFMSNPDSNEVLGILARIDPARTLFLVSSKTFTTQDTLANFFTARAFMARSHGSEAAAMGHFCAITAAPAAASAQGFGETRIFRFRDWVGGRYSLWSTIGLPIAMAIGAPRFLELLAGARAMDRHFREAPWNANLPVLMALCGIWNVNVLDARTVLVVPYDARLAALPAYVQQLDMESNGKGVDLAGQPLARSSGPVVWGSLGINGQHAYFQLVHQGTQRVPVEFIGVMQSPQQDLDHQRIVFSNLLAQAEALMCGRSREQVRSEMVASGMDTRRADLLAGHRSFPGNIPSSTLLIDVLSPARLGALIALYEHKVFTQGVIWGINSFDQWGVELGKQLGKTIYQELVATPDPRAHDPSTRQLVARVFAALR
jgi:glucose-6-phosphate isomerase